MFQEKYIEAIKFGEHKSSNYKIDVLDTLLNPYTFYTNYIIASKPVIFKNAALFTPAFNLWTDSYLRLQI